MSITADTVLIRLYRDTTTEVADRQFTWSIIEGEPGGGGSEIASGSFLSSDLTPNDATVLSFSVPVVLQNSTLYSFRIIPIEGVTSPSSSQSIIKQYYQAKTGFVNAVVNWYWYDHAPYGVWSKDNSSNTTQFQLKQAGVVVLGCPSFGAGTVQGLYGIVTAPTRDGTSQRATSFTTIADPTPAPENPTPTDTATDVDPQIAALTWECDGTPDGYYVYFGTLSPTLRAHVTEKSWSPDFILDLSTTYTWKVVAIYGETEETSPEWTFETRDISFYLSPPINPTPDIDATGVPVRTAALTWENGGGATSYDVYFREGTTGDFTKLTTTSTAALTKAVSGLKYTTTYTWRVDAHNQWGTVAGTEWAFTVFALIPPLPTGQNAMATVRRLVAVANNAFWYESI